MSLIINPRIKVTDTNGDPIVGAELTIRDVGTSNLKAISLDSALQIDANNPILSDSNGRFPALYADGQYKITILDAPGGNTLFDDDFVEAATVSSATTTTEGIVQFATTAEVAAQTGSKVIKSSDTASIPVLASQVSGELSVANIPLLPTSKTEALAVGAIYISVLATNPATTLGYGTWAAFAQGRVLIGVGQGTDDNAVNKTIVSAESAGEYVHTQTESELVAHTHTDAMTEDGSNTASNAERGSGAASGTLTTDSTGGGTAFNILQPYLGVFIWERTA